MVRLLTRRVIANLEGDPYLVRWTLFSCPWFGIFLHHILRSDDDRDMHDHPWDFWSLILWGYYREHVPMDWPPLRDRCGKVMSESKVFGPGSLIRHKARDAHRLELPKPVWTLFFHGRRKRHWGFYTPQGWMPWEKYIETIRHQTDTAPMEDC